jgi:geranylgeranyl reductase family protein
MPDDHIRCDVAVVGSGPAGASAARVAAEAGLDVVIVEKAKLPRYKTCGGGVVGRALRLLGLEVIPIADRACCTAELNISQELRFVTSRRWPIVVMTMRDKFDQWLTQVAVDAGARLIEETVVEDVEILRDHVLLTTERGSVQARFVIAADGAGSVVAKRAGWPAHPHVVPALEWEVAVHPEDLARLGGAARFDFNAVPQGYGWSFPKQGHLSIGVATLNAQNANLNQCLARYLTHLGVHDPISIQRHGFVIPLSPRARVLGRGRIMLVGDAAGFADPLTGEGISHAIHSGQLAAEAIVSCRRREGAVCGAYNAAVHRKIIAELRWARRLARLLYQMPRCRDALFRWQGQALAEVMTEVVAGKADYDELLTEPLNYLRLLRRNPVSAAMA